MSKIDMLKGSPKEINLCGVDVKINPLKLKNMDLLIKMNDSEKQAEAVSEIIKLTLRDAFPDASEEDLNNVSFEHFEKLMEVILEVNGLKKK